MRYLIALIFSFAFLSVSVAQQTPQQQERGTHEDDRQLEQRQEDFGMEEDETEPGAQDRYYEGERQRDFGEGEQQRDYGDEATTPQTPQDYDVRYESDDNRLRVKEAEDGSVIINYNQHGLTEEGEQDMTGRQEGFGMEDDAQLEEEEFETVFESEDENLKVKENEEGEVMIKYGDRAEKQHKK